MGLGPLSGGLDSCVFSAIFGSSQEILESQALDLAHVIHPESLAIGSGQLVLLENDPSRSRDCRDLFFDRVHSVSLRGDGDPLMPERKPDSTLPSGSGPFG